MNCIYECVSPKCYSQIYSSDPIEDGEIDYHRYRLFALCVRQEVRDIEIKNRKWSAMTRYSCLLNSWSWADMKLYSSDSHSRAIKSIIWCANTPLVVFVFTCCGSLRGRHHHWQVSEQFKQTPQLMTSSCDSDLRSYTTIWQTLSSPDLIVQLEIVEEYHMWGAPHYAMNLIRICRISYLKVCIHYDTVEWSGRCCRSPDCCHHRKIILHMYAFSILLMIKIETQRFFLHFVVLR